MVHVIIKKIALGTSKAKRQKMVLEWTSCNDTIINEIRKIFPDIYLRFDKESAWGKTLHSKMWSH